MDDLRNRAQRDIKCGRRRFKCFQCKLLHSTITNPSYLWNLEHLQNLVQILIHDWHKRRFNPPQILPKSSKLSSNCSLFLACYPLFAITLTVFGVHRGKKTTNRIHSYWSSLNELWADSKIWPMSPLWQILVLDNLWSLQLDPIQTDISACPGLNPPTSSIIPALEYLST